MPDIRAGVRVCVEDGPEDGDEATEGSVTWGVVTKITSAGRTMKYYVTPDGLSKPTFHVGHEHVLEAIQAALDNAHHDPLVLAARVAQERAEAAEAAAAAAAEAAEAAAAEAVILIPLRGRDMI